MMPVKDITDENDVRALVDAFYEKVRADERLNPIFTEVVEVDWDTHLPKMYAFWNNLILGIPGYSGRPFPKHMELPVDRSHFERWLELFKATVDEHFSGRGAEQAKNGAASIAHTFALRMGLLEDEPGPLM